MSILAISLPQVLFYAVIAGLVVSVFVPWLDTIQRHDFYVVMSPAIVATILWKCFDYFYLMQPPPIGDPLNILANLIFFYPLLTLTWISTTLAVGASRRKHHANKLHG